MRTDHNLNEDNAVRYVISHWEAMTWAEKIYYRAKYGFDHGGVLDIRISQHVPRNASLRTFWKPNSNSDDVLPIDSQVGSNDRLRLLLTETRLTAQRSTYDDTALVHLGPDDSSVITAEHFWGLPYSDRGTHVELDARYTCSWETSLGTWCPEAPWWAVWSDC